jgi:hypothetical protein
MVAGRALLLPQLLGPLPNGHGPINIAPAFEWLDGAAVQLRWVFGTLRRTEKRISDAAVFPFGALPLLE